MIEAEVTTGADDGPPCSPALDPLLARAMEQARTDATRHLRHLLGVDLAGWLDEGRSRSPVVGRVDPRAWDSLGVLDALTHHLTRHDLGDADQPQEQTRLVCAVDGIDRDVVPQGEGVFRRHAPGRPVRANVATFAAWVAAGTSCKVRDLHVASPALGMLVDDLERLVGVRVGLMAYLSSADARGWGAHYDRHDGIVVQLVGSKRWRLHPPIEQNPLRPWSPYQVSETVTDDLTLERGDVLLVPRGWGHEVVGTERPSVHLTVPIRSPTAGDLLAERSADTDAAGWIAVQRAGVAPRAVATLITHDLALRALATHQARPAGGSLRLAVTSPAAIAALPDGSLLVTGRRVPATTEAVAVLAALVARGGAALQDVVDRGRATAGIVTNLLRDGTVQVLPEVETRSSEVSADDVERALSAPTARSTVTPAAAITVPPRAVRPLDRSQAGECDLAEILERRRSDAARATHLLLGFDLSTRTGGGATLEPIASRIEPSMFEVEKARAVVDEVLANRDLPAGRFSVAFGELARNRGADDGLYLGGADGTTLRRLHVPALHRFLGDGGTAIAFGVDDFDASLSATAGLIETATGLRSGMNAYVSHGRHPSGFGAHWDDHDVVVIQVLGSKRWEVFAPAVRWPVLGHSSESVAGARHSVHLLRAGDVLHVPRGWGHLVTGEGGLSIHLTLPLRPPVAADALRVVLDDEPDEAQRRDLRRAAPAPLTGTAALAAGMSGRWTTQVLELRRAAVPPRVVHDRLWIDPAVERMLLATPAGAAVVDDGDHVVLALGAVGLRMARANVAGVARLAADAGATAAEAGDLGLVAGLAAAGLLEPAGVLPADPS